MKKYIALYAALMFSGSCFMALLFVVHPVSGMDCASARLGAVNLAKAHPEIDVLYHGPQQDQCQLNEVVEQVRR